MKIANNDDLGAAQSPKSNAEVEQASPIKIRPLIWSEQRHPFEGCRYTHVVAESSLGQIRIEWKDWKELDSYSLYVDGGHVSESFSLEEAKSAAERHILSIVLLLLVEEAPIEKLPAESILKGDMLDRRYMIDKTCDLMFTVLKEMVQMMDCGDEQGAGSVWHTRACEALSSYGARCTV